MANIQADWVWQPFLYTEMEIYSRTYNRYNICVLREREACHRQASMLEHTMIVGRADNYHVIAIGHVKVSVNPLPVLVVLRPLQLHLVLQ